MDIGQLLIDISVNLIITVIAYMLVPVYLWASAKKYDISKIKKIITVNAIVLFVIFTIIQISNGNTTANVGACFLWSSVGYAFMKKKCLKEDSDEQETITISDSESEQTITHICLSNNDEQPKEYGDFNIYSKDVLLETSEKTVVTPTTPNTKSTMPNKQKKKTGFFVIVSIISVFAIMVIGIVAATINAANKKAHKEDTDYQTSENIETTHFDLHAEEDYQPLENIEPDSYIEYDSYYVGVRMITFSDNFTAEYVLGLWERGEATEESMKDLMDEYGEEQGGGQLYVIEQGHFIDEVDEWCFDRSRQVGDVEIIENDYGFSLCYFSSVVER